MKLWTARYDLPYAGGLAVVAAETKERAAELLKDDCPRWREPTLLLEGVDCGEGVLDSDYYSE